ncbi:MAG TPA: SRPBCC domain-containing protein [Thermomicrobiales bacterium]|nr:SRPBCC domain-containing protein [Thermomicrobiales bacterium]
MDDVFRALADRNRRLLLDRLNARNGQSLRDLCAGLEMTRQSVSKHLAVLEEANLVTAVWRGREKLHYLNVEPINAIAERWINHFDRARVRALTDLKLALEGSSMTDASTFVYTTYIRTSPEKLWQALTEPAFTQRYWGLAFETDWKTGSPIIWHQGDIAIANPEQKVVEANPFTRLSYTWHTFTPEWYETARGFVPDDFMERIATERRSKVTFEIEDQGGKVKLTVIHDDFDPGSVVLESVSGGWPPILSNLKTLLETGELLP